LSGRVGLIKDGLIAKFEAAADTRGEYSLQVSNVKHINDKEIHFMNSVLYIVLSPAFRFIIFKSFFLTIAV